MHFSALVELYLPASQSQQLVFKKLEYLPGVHVVQVVEAGVEKEPASHCRHLSAPVSLYWPAPQSSQNDFDGFEYLPAAQVVQL